MSLREVAAQLRARVVSMSDARLAVSKSQYMRGVAEFAGIAAPGVNSIFVDVGRSACAAAAVADCVALSRDLLSDPVHEVKQLGILSLEARLKARSIARESPSERVSILSMIAECADAGAVRDWATCDGLSSKVLNTLLVHALDEDGSLSDSSSASSSGGPQTRAMVEQLQVWADSGAVWKQRMACVAYVRIARRGLLTDAALRAADATVRNAERFAQLGAGWCVRDVGESRQAEAVAFIEAHMPHWSPEGLRYATEKLPSTLQTRLKRALKRPREES